MLTQSIAAMRRISIAKGIAKKIIESSYVKRDSLALIAFKGYQAEILVPPTRRYANVMDALQGVKTGGRTPLSSALQTLLTLTRSFRMKNKNCVVKSACPSNTQIVNLLYIIKSSDVSGNHVKNLSNL